MDKARDLSLFARAGEAIFDKDFSRQEAEIVYDKTDFFLNPDNYENISRVRDELAELDEEGFDARTAGSLAKGKILDLESLANLVSLLETVAGNRGLFGLLADDTDLQESEDFVRFFKRQILREFRRFAQRDGTIDYFKHPKLRDLRQKQLELETAARQTLGKLQSFGSYQEALQFSGHDIINDKYALAIKSDRYSSSLGSIVARSESGRTLYVEPPKLRPVNRERFEVLLKMDQIIHEITREFCGKLSPWSDAIGDFISLVFSFDQFSARAKLAEEFGLTRPSLTDKPEIRLEGFFHPLIEDPVKNSLDIKAGAKGMIISGPNTGGKTAAIKAVALSCLFAKKGLYIPAATGSLCLFENIFYFGNDQQNLPEGLSSFAAETANYARLLKSLGDSNLIVIDEIFNSTSSEEASALAMALFNQIGDNPGSKLIVSTHHQTLKTLTHAREDFISCHVGFDSELGRPTYKLVFGFPGKSMALEVFKEITAGDETCQSLYAEAVKKLDNKAVNYEKLLSELSGKEEKLSKLLDSNQRLNAELKNQKESAKALARLKVEEEAAKAKEKLDAVIAEAEETLRQAKAGQLSGKRQLEKKGQTLKSKLAKLAPAQDGRNLFNRKAAPGKGGEGMSKPAALEPGKRYYCAFINQTVVLKEPPRNGKATVSKGAMTIKCPADTLWLAGGEKPRERVVVSAAASSRASLEHDCRGMRLSEFQNLVESVVPELLSGSLPFVNFIHGHGNGILKDWLRNYIKRNPDIERDQSENGNDGETRLICS